VAKKNPPVRGGLNGLDVVAFRRLNFDMDPVTLYAIGICMGFTAESMPCSAHLYSVYDPDSDYVWTRPECLRRAERIEAKDPVKYKAYCIGKNGVSLDSKGQVVDRVAYFKALADWHDRHDAKKLPTQQVLEIGR
jgi:hypothetical protein